MKKEEIMSSRPQSSIMRGTRSRNIIILAVLGGILILLYLLTDANQKWSVYQFEAMQCQQRRDSLSAQLQVTIEHKGRIDVALQEEKAQHSKLKEEYFTYKQTEQNTKERDQEAMQKRLSALQEQITLLQKQNEDINGENAQLSSKYEKSINEVKETEDDFRTQLMRKDLKIKSMMDQLQTLTSEKSNLVNKVIQLKNSLKTATNEIEDSKKNVRSSTTKIELKTDLNSKHANISSTSTSNILAVTQLTPSTSKYSARLSSSTANSRTITYNQSSVNDKTFVTKVADNQVNPENNVASPVKQKSKELQGNGPKDDLSDVANNVAHEQNARDVVEQKKIENADDVKDSYIQNLAQPANPNQKFVDDDGNNVNPARETWAQDNKIPDREAPIGRNQLDNNINNNNVLINRRKNEEVVLDKDQIDEPNLQKVVPVYLAHAKSDEMENDNDIDGNLRQPQTKMDNIVNNNNDLKELDEESKKLLQENQLKVVKTSKDDENEGEYDEEGDDRDDNKDDEEYADKHDPEGVQDERYKKFGEWNKKNLADKENANNAARLALRKPIEHNRIEENVHQNVIAAPH